MTDITPRKNRRKVLQDIAGVGALAGMAPLLGRLIPSAHAQGINAGVLAGQGSVLHVAGAGSAAVNIAEWDPPPSASADAETGGIRIAYGDAPIGRAPATASRYTAKTFDFPSGALRVLTWKKGGPVVHQITFETVVRVLDGSVTREPAKGINTKTAALKAGDVIHLPSGVLRNMKPTTDTVLLQAFVASASDRPKSSVVLARNVKQTSAPKDSEARYTMKRYALDGNSIRAFKFAAGGKLTDAQPQRADVLIYVAKGRVRRTESGQTFEAVAGDAIREAQGGQGGWEFLEDSELIAMDSPVRPAAFSPGLVGKVGGVQFYAMMIDENGRSCYGMTSAAMKPVSATESFSEKHPGTIWRLGPRPAINPKSRTTRGYTSNTGPYEMHTGGPPHFTGCMAGHTESTLQDGGVLRRGAGEFNYITPGALHHSNFRSDVAAVYFNLYVPGSDTDTKVPTF